MAALHGKTGAVKFGINTLCVTTWDFTDTSENADSTGSCSGGFGEVTPGLRKGTGSFAGNFALADIAKYPTAGTAATIYLVRNNITSGLGITGPVVVSSVAHSTPISGLVTITCNFDTTGPYAEYVLSGAV